MDSLLLSKLENKIDLNTLITSFCDNDYKKAGLVIKELIDYGFNINKELDSKGNIIYSIGNDIVYKDLNINLDSDELKTLIISDMHIGNFNDGLTFIDRVYEYAKEKGINIIFNIGDLFRGVYPECTDKLSELKYEIDLFNDKYPFYNNIVNVVILGNHDYVTYKSFGFDIGKYISLRPDFINLGYGLGKVKIGNSSILLEHDLLFVPQPERDNYAKYIFRGHSHKFEIVGNQITVPALLDSNFYNNLTSLGFLEADFKLDSSNNIESCLLKQFDFKDNIREINKIELHNKNTKIKKKI